MFLQDSGLKKPLNTHFTSTFCKKKNSRHTFENTTKAKMLKDENVIFFEWSQH